MLSQKPEKNYGIFNIRFQGAEDSDDIQLLSLKRI